MRIDDNASFIYFLYPFFFNEDRYSNVLENIDNTKWAGSKDPIKVWQTRQFSENNLLPQVANFLNPPSNINPTTKSWYLTHDALTSIDSGLGAGAHRSNVEWKIMTPYKEIPFQICSVQLTLFYLGVGLLIIHVTPKKGIIELDAWLDFIHYFRFCCGQRETKLVAQRRAGVSSADHKPLFAPFFPQPSGGLEKHPDGRGTLYDLITGMLSNTNSQIDSNTWWEDAYVHGQLLPFIGLFIDDVPDEEIYQIRYLVRNFFQSNKTTTPTGDELTPTHPSLLSYGSNQWLLFSVDGGGYLGCNTPTHSFYRNTLPSHLKNEYCLLFILALEQRFTLMKLSEHVGIQWMEYQNHKTANINQLESNFNSIHNQLLCFTARGYFVQTMQTQHHHRCYQKWQETFQLGELFDEVNSKVRYIYEYIQSNKNNTLQQLEKEQNLRQEMLEKKLNLLAWIFVVTSLFLSYSQAIGPVKPSIAIVLVISGLIIGVLLYILMNYFTKRSIDHGRTRDD